MAKKSEAKENVNEQEELINNDVENSNEAKENVEEAKEENSENSEAEAEIEKEEKEEISGEEKLEKELLDMKDKYARLSAEFDNYRKRTLKEKMDLTKSAGEKLLKDLLPVKDNFERANASIENAKDIEALKEGISLIYNRFSEFLTQQGIKEIETKEADFDTDVHEAITKIPAPSEELKGKIVDCVEKGYYLNDKVIRFAKVVIGE